MKHCKRTTELLLDYIEEKLNIDLKKEMDCHFTECRTCQIVLSTYKKTVHLCCKALKVTVPQGLEDRLLKHLKSKLPSGSKSSQ